MYQVCVRVCTSCLCMRLRVHVLCVGVCICCVCVCTECEKVCAYIVCVPERGVCVRCWGGVCHDPGAVPPRRRSRHGRWPGLREASSSSGGREQGSRSARSL